MIAQIYEIQDPYQAEKCIQLGVDHIGSVIPSEENWRQSAIREVIRISEHTESRNSLIPLFQTQETIFKALDFYQPDYVHFCQNLTDDKGHIVDLANAIHIQSEIREKFPEIGIIRTIPIPQNHWKGTFPFLEIARGLKWVSQFFLIDTWVGSEPVEGFVGITGKTANWRMASELVGQSPIPVVLAGGLSPDNVYEAILKVIPFGADSCTRTNQVGSDGKPIRFRKDFNKVQVFVQEIRRAEQTLKDRYDNLRLERDTLLKEREDRGAALPAHSVRPDQIMLIEELEEKIREMERELVRIGRGINREFRAPVD